MGFFTLRLSKNSLQYLHISFLILISHHYLAKVLFRLLIGLHCLFHWWEAVDYFHVFLLKQMLPTSLYNFCPCQTFWILFRERWLPAHKYLALQTNLLFSNDLINTCIRLLPPSNLKTIVKLQWTKAVCIDR